jgi:hypothetical protein
MSRDDGEVVGEGASDSKSIVHMFMVYGFTRHQK